jgi:RNA polymerase sigma-70 factor (ECF subfamily)
MTYKFDLTSVFLSSKNKLTRVIAKIVPTADVEDILQEAYLRAHTTINREEIREPVAFMTQIAKNLALDHVRSADFKKSQAVDAETMEALINQHNTRDQTLTHAIWKQDLVEFLNAIQSLPNKCREVYVLKKIYGYSQKEIAEKLGISTSAVEKHIAYGTKKLFHLMPTESEKRINCNVTGIADRRL